MSGTWVRRAADRHQCDTPAPEGTRDDLWRCDDCGKLWRLGSACDACETYRGTPHAGQHSVGYGWRTATLWQRLLFDKPREGE